MTDHNNHNGVDSEETAKLELRLGHLKWTFEEEKTHYENHMVDINLSLHKIITYAADCLFPQLDPEFTVDLTIHADYQTSVAFKIVKKLKTQGLSASPVQVAQQIVAQIPPNCIIRQSSVSGSGFINIYLRDEFIIAQVDRILSTGVRPPVLRTPTLSGPVLLDMSSPNIAKEMHVGHLRSTILGEGFARLFDFAWRREIIKISHVGDWGTQFGMLIAHLENSFPNFRTHTPSIGNLQTFYKESKVRFEEDQEFRKRAYETVVQLQQYNPDHMAAWKTICHASFCEFSKIYERLKIVDLINRGESFYNEMMPHVVNELEERGLVKVEDGRKLVFVDFGASYPLTVVKSDGGFTYDTSDCTALRHRLTEERVSSIYYVVDAGQSEHLEGVFEVARMAGWLTGKQCVVHLKFGVVLGDDKKRLKTRSGKTIRLAQLLDEGLRRSTEKLIEKGRDKVLTMEQFDLASRAVAYGCIKYSDLMHNRLHDYVFSFDRMLDDRGNTAVYLLYSYVRMASILRQAGMAHLNTVNQNGEFDHPSERKICFTLLQFPTVVNRALDELGLHVLCEYAYSLCSVFSDFYEKCHCIDNTDLGKVLNMDRLSIVKASSLVLEVLFDILGIDKLEYI